MPINPANLPLLDALTAFTTGQMSPPSRDFQGADRLGWAAAGNSLSTSSWGVTFQAAVDGTAQAVARRVMDDSGNTIYFDPTPNVLRVLRDYATTDGAWSITAAALGLSSFGGAQREYVITHTDGSAPQVAVDGGAFVSMTQVTAPVGAINTAPARILYLGNSPGSDRPLVGRLSNFAIYDRALTTTDRDAQGLSGVAATPKWHYSLDGTSPEPNLGSGGTKDMVVTGTSALDGWPYRKVDTDDGAYPILTGGQLARGASAGSRYWQRSYAKPMGVRLKLPVLPTAVMYLWLVQTGAVATPTGYQLRYDPAGTLDFTNNRINAGVSTFVGGDDISAKPISAGDELAMGIEADGTLKSWVFHSGAWVLIDSDVDGSALAGPFFPGLFLNDTVVRATNFGGGQEIVPGTGLSMGLMGVGS